MPSENTLRVLKSARVGSVSRLARRVAGLQYLNMQDFLPQLSRSEAERLTGLARRARGGGPAPILIFGVMPRSGTNFLHDLVGLHPQVHADPGQIYEFPLLHAAKGAKAFMEEFISLFPRNQEVLNSWDALAMLSGAWMRELQRDVGDKHILLKCPHVQNLTLAPLIFPDAKIILCVRDGRDVIDSSMKTFSSWSLSRKTFAQLSREWRLGTEAIYSFAPGGENAHPDVSVVRYEDVVGDTQAALNGILGFTGLSPDDYPMDKVETLPVRGSSRSDAAKDARWQPQEKSKDFNPVKRWANWSDKQKSRFERIAGPALEVAGYES